MIEPTVNQNDILRVEGQVTDVKSKFDLIVKGGPTISISGEVQAKTIKIVILGVCILSALCTILAGYIGRILVAG